MVEETSWSRPLHEILRIERTGDWTFSAVLEGFGGVTLGCAALAAGRTCPERSLHSFHTYFLRPVPPGATVELAVEPLRDGRRVSHRRVQVRLADKVFCEMVAGFAAPGEGTAYQDALVDPATPPPDELPTEEEIARAEGWKLDEPGPIGGPLEWRWIGIPWRTEDHPVASRYRGWVRPRSPLPDDRALHIAALAYLSDYHSHFSVARMLRGHFEPFDYASLDQVLWLHCDRPWDDWWLLTTESDVAYAGRALSRRILHARDGQVIASMAQEQLIPDVR